MIDQPASVDESSGDGESEQRPAKFWQRAFVVVASVFCTAMFLVLPPLNGADASGHYARVVLIADGWLIPPPTGTARSTYQLDGCVVAVLRGGSLTRPK